MGRNANTQGWCEMIYKAKVKRFEIYRNDTAPYLTMAQVKAKTGCDVIFNGTLQG